MHPLLGDSAAFDAERLRALLRRTDAVVIGPGLSLDPTMLQQAASIYAWALDAGKRIVVDGDGLRLFGSPRPAGPAVVLTPNHREFRRLQDGLCGGPAGGTDQAALQSISRALHSATIVLKGPADRICAWRHPDGPARELECRREGSPRRCGGQGDLLAGTIAALSCGAPAAGPESPADMLPAVCLAACEAVRDAAHRCFQDRQWAMLTSDLLHYLRKPRGPL